jgi:hypothetical protein
MKNADPSLRSGAEADHRLVIMSDLKVRPPKRNQEEDAVLETVLLARWRDGHAWVGTVKDRCALGLGAYYARTHGGSYLRVGADDQMRCKYEF